MVDDRREPDPVETEGLRDWGHRWEPPHSLLERTARALRARGLVRPERRRRWMPAVWAAALAAVFVAGYLAGDRRSAPEPSRIPAATTSNQEATMQAADRYALLLFESDEYRPAPTADAQTDRVREYGAWIRAKGENGRFVDGEKLAKDGRWCRVRSGQVEVLDPVSDGARGILAGYFILGASSYDEAVGLARDCPHLRYGGTIEVRRIES